MSQGVCRFVNEDVRAESIFFAGKARHFQRHKDDSVLRQVGASGLLATACCVVILHAVEKTDPKSLIDWFRNSETERVSFHRLVGGFENFAKMTHRTLRYRHVGFESKVLRFMKRLRAIDEFPSYVRFVDRLRLFPGHVIEIEKFGDRPPLLNEALVIFLESKKRNVYAGSVRLFDRYRKLANFRDFTLKVLAVGGRPDACGIPIHKWIPGFQKLEFLELRESNPIVDFVKVVGSR